MLLRTHFVIAILAYLLLFPILPEKIIFLIFFLLATVFVDIDSKKSKIGKHWYLRPLQWVVSHRGIFHTLFFAIILSGVIYYFNQYAGLGFFAGYVLHLALDCLTTRGVKLFWPVFDFKIGFFVHSGGLIEEILFVLVLLADLFLTYSMFFQ
jgi:membrane-bound metal-dependent hydrolase YbcI (DUF457 family)